MAMGLIYITWPMSHSQEWFMSFLGDKFSENLLCMYNLHGNDLHTFKIETWSFTIAKMYRSMKKYCLKEGYVRREVSVQ